LIESGAAAVVITDYVRDGVMITGVRVPESHITAVRDAQEAVT